MCNANSSFIFCGGVRYFAQRLLPMMGRLQQKFKITAMSLEANVNAKYI